MPEIAGKNGIFANPEKEECIAQNLLKLEHDIDFYKTQTEYGLQQVKQFSWTQTALSLLTIYQSIKK